ncbi:peroxiredoxin [Agitococcus lubricus]|uniref:thioredoxin-dependent peroxiredoxin n=1 Tax=Agitococcus lubricus TaxID=1077255 RepID=A0A2T5IWU9_9GAMM|nr:peroxiredoxin [Agitococcus lubricus]PTQ88421.1 peroxiredoxin Q/BCP [Agitococcus lubricus]
MRLLSLVFGLLLSVNVMAAEWVGSPAPAFALPDQNGKIHRLADYKGKWLVLYFYPKNHTGGCTEEAKRFRDQFTTYKQRGIAIAGVSVDSVESHKKFSDDLKLPFTLLSDSGKVLSKQLGVLNGFGPMSFTSRETFLIDPQGNIVYHYDSVSPHKHATQVLEDVARLSKS